MQLIWSNPSQGDADAFDKSGAPYPHYMQTMGYAPVAPKAGPPKGLIKRFVTEHPLIAPELLGLTHETTAKAARVFDCVMANASEDAVNPAAAEYDTDSETDAPLLSDDALPPDPHKAVVIGVIDGAIPFAHQRFSINATASRTAAFWQMDGRFKPGPVGRDLPFGRELRGGKISNCLKQVKTGTIPSENAIYETLGVVDYTRESPQVFANLTSHGAAVSGIAAGFDPNDDAARNFPLIAVSLPPTITGDTLGILSPAYLLIGVAYILDRSRRLARHLERKHGLEHNSLALPVVINISYGVTAGAKDGSSPLAQLQQALSQAPQPGLGPVHFVLPMGNNRQSELCGVLEADEEIGWSVRPDDHTPSFLEIRSANGPRPDAPMQLTFAPEGAETPATTSFSHHGSFQDLTLDGRTVARAYLLFEGAEDSGREVIILVLPPTRPTEPGNAYGTAGIWRLSASGTGPLQIDVQRDDSIRGLSHGGRQSKLQSASYTARDASGFYLLEDPDGTACPIRRAGSQNAYANGSGQIRVGGSVAKAPQIPIAFSSRATGADGRAPNGDALRPCASTANQTAINVIGSRSGSRSALTGTSLSSPQIARELALWMSDSGARPQTRADALAFLQEEALLG